MVAFGKKLKELQIQEWKGSYIDYKLLKKKVKHYARQDEVDGPNREYVLHDFSLMLDEQIEKIVLFLLKHQGQLATRLSGLADRDDEYLSHGPNHDSIVELREAYREVGRDLLRLLFFVEMNAIGLRKILKKFDKRLGYKFTSYYVKTRANHPYSQLRQVFKHVVQTKISKNSCLLLFVVAVLQICNHWVSAQWPPARILTRRWRVRVLLVPNAPTVADLPQTQACWVAVCEVGSPRRLGGPWNIPPPQSCRYASPPYLYMQGISAVVGSITRNLADLQDVDRRYVSIYDHPNIHISDPIIESIKAAEKRLLNSTDFLHYLGKHAFIMQDELPSPSSEEHIVNERYHFMSLLLNLVNTFLYMVNTYIIVPTADDYSLSLGAAATVCGVVIGSMAVAQIFSSVYFSAWSNKSYIRPLIFSSIVLLMGNTLYALAYDLNSIYVLLIGRLFCGLGSARAVNRRYISDCVPSKLRMKASAGFVSASALGMACGPALACLFQTQFKILWFTFNQDTLPGWFMAFAWFIYLLWLWLSFREPPLEKEDIVVQHETSGTTVEIGFSEPLLLDFGKNEEDEDQQQEDDDPSDELSEDNREPVTSIMSAYRLLTPSVKVQLIIYFMLKYAMEILLAESSVVTSYYFVWSTNNVAMFLAFLGLTVLPVSIFVGSYISNVFEERQVLLASEIMVCLGIVLSFHTIIPYSAPQYIFSALLTFVSAEVLEGVNLSLLSRVMSSRLSRGTYNGGLLSTEAGTLARVVADGTITLAGYWGMSELLNITLLPSLVICIATIIATSFTYNSLY